MHKLIKFLLAAVLVAGLIAGLGSALPMRAADGDVILYRVNAGGPTISATDGGPDWVVDTDFYTGTATGINTITDSLDGPLVGAAPEAVFRTNRDGTPISDTLSYAFDVTPDREYQINLYFADHVRYPLTRTFGVSVNGDIPAEFDNITLVSTSSGSLHVPALYSTTVTAAGSTLELVGVRQGAIGYIPLVNGIEIIELAPPDTEPPTVSITSPSHGAGIWGTVEFRASASDNVGVTQVSFHATPGIGGTEIVIDTDTDGSDGWSIDWDTTTFTDGFYYLTAKASDGAGNTTVSASRTVYINNIAPTVEIIEPGDGETVSGGVTLQANTTDHTSGGVYMVQYYHGDTLISQLDYAEPNWPYTWDTTSVPDGPYTLKAVATDNGGKTAEHSITVTVDNTAPVVNIESPTGGTVSDTETITATASDTSGVNQVEFFCGIQPIGGGLPVDGKWVLEWDTTGYGDGECVLTAKAMDNAGNLGTSQPVTLTVDNNAAPTVQIDSPANGATVSATITIEASASDTGDDGGVVQVEFFVDGVSIGVDDSALGGWTTSWDTTTASDGPHTLKAIATDNGGKTGEHSIQVTVDNNAAPVISITHPANGQTVSGTITVSADTDDDVVSVEFSIPDVLYLGTDEDGSDGWSVSWDTTGLPDGEYMMNARATDAGGKSTLSAPVWVVVDNTPTAFGITAPANGATVAGQVDVTTGCNDALLYVELYLDGEYLGEATLVDGVWVFPWDTTLVEDGEYTLHAFGMTEREEGIESPPVTVTVQNSDDPIPPDDEPTPTGPEVQPGMLCSLDDGSLNAEHCGRPVAIFRSGNDLHLYGIDINTGNGMLAMLVTEAAIAEVGEPADVPVLIAVGENPYTHRPIALYRLPGGEFQLNTLYWDGKEYVVKWRPDAQHVEVVVW